MSTNWASYKTRPNKIQFLNAGNQTESFDTDSCVTFSILKAFQTLGNASLHISQMAWLKDNGYLNEYTNYLSPKYATPHFQETPHRHPKQSAPIKPVQ